MKRLFRLAKRKKSRHHNRPVYVQNLEPRQLLSAVMWDGDVSGAWSTAANWENDTAPASSDVATFDGNSANTTITLSSNTTISSLQFLSGASAFTISNQRFDLYSVSVESGVFNDQTVNSLLKGSGSFTATNNGTGDLLLNSYTNTSGDQEAIYNHNINATGDITFRGSVTTSGRTFQVIKNGAGTLSYESTFDFNLGYRTNGTIEQSKFIVNDGTLDISQMTLNFESNTGSGGIDPANLIDTSYVLVDYTNGSVIVDGTNIFGTVTNLPDGFEIYHDTANKQILLREIQGIPGQWIGDVSGSWQTAENWVGDDVPSTGEIAYFGDLSQNTTITLSNNVAVNQLNFMDGASAHTINGQRFDLYSVIVEDGVTNDQEINSLLKGHSNFTVRNLGTGELLLGAYSNTSGDQSAIYTHTVEANGDVTFEGSVTTSGRSFQVNKTGSGKLAYLSTFDFNLGHLANGNVEQSMFIVDEGTLDISQMDLKFESNTGSGAIDPATLVNDSYVLVDYSGGGSVVTDSTNIFGNVTNLPDGFTIVHDTANSQIILQKSVVGIYVMAGGTGDGSSYNSPLGVANMTALKAAWDNLAPGETLYLINSPQLQDVSGGFYNTTFTMNTGGTVVNNVVQYKSLVGVADSNGNYPTLLGSWDKGDGSTYKRGIYITGSDVGHINISNINIQHMEYGIQMDNSSKTDTNQIDWDVHIDNVHISSVRYGMYIDGGAQGVDGAGSRNVTIDNSSVTGMEKHGVRLKDGMEHVTISNVTVDAGGQAWDGERFHIGFAVDAVDGSNAPNRYISYYNTVAQNAYDDYGSNYWNGDGYTTERYNEYIYYYGAKAFNNTDAGFDVKSDHVYFYNTVAMGNSRNYRIWSRNDAVMDNIVSAWGYSAKSGSNGGTGIWLNTDAVVTINNATIHNVTTGIQIEDGGNSGMTQVTITNSIISATNTSVHDFTNGSYTNALARMSYTNCKFYGKTGDSLTNTTTNPLYVDADDTDDTDGDGRYFADGSVIWEFLDDAFDATDSSYAGLGFDNDQPLP